MCNEHGGPPHKRGGTIQRNSASATLDVETGWKTENGSPLPYCGNIRSIPATRFIGANGTSRMPWRWLHGPSLTHEKRRHAVFPQFRIGGEEEIFMQLSSGELGFLLKWNDE